MCEMYLKKKQKKKTLCVGCLYSDHCQIEGAFHEEIKDQPQSDTSLLLDANIWGTFCSLETEL